MTSVLFVCRANVCRSPMAAALLRSRLLEAGIRAAVTSAGTMALNKPADPVIVQIMAARGIDLSGHLGTQMTAQDLTGADLVVTMSRDSLRDAVVLEPCVWPHTFTIKELVRAARAHPRRGQLEPVADWLARISSDRERGRLLGSHDCDDVADPTGRPVRAYELTAELLSGLVDELVVCCWGGAAIAGPRQIELPIEKPESSWRFS